MPAAWLAKSKVSVSQALALPGVVAVLTAADVPGENSLGGYSVEGPWEGILSANIIGCYNVFEAARRNGVKRILFPTSNHAVGFYRRDQAIDHRVYIKPDSRYGVSKVFGEALGSLYADKYGMEVFCMRIGNVNATPIDKRRLSILFTPRDLAQLVTIGIEHPDIRRMLMTMRAQTEAMRAVAYVTSAAMDNAHRLLESKEKVAFDLGEEKKDMSPLFQTILDHVPPPFAKPNEPFHMLVSNIDWSDYVGRIAVGKILGGNAKVGEPVKVSYTKEKDGKMLATHIWVGKEEIEKAAAALLAQQRQAQTEAAQKMAIQNELASSADPYGSDVMNRLARLPGGLSVAERDGPGFVEQEGVDVACGLDRAA